MDSNYKIEALAILLDRECLSERYYSLIEYKETLLSGLRDRGVETKNEAEALPDEAFVQMGMEDEEQIRLLRRFFTIYDANPRKFREIDRVTDDPEARKVFRELYFLPGVKYIRANLYDLSGYRTLRDIAASTPEEILARTKRTIEEMKLACIVPLPREVRTHIAVARAFCLK